MRLLTHPVRFKSGERFVLVPLGDVHFGSSNCDVDAFDEAIEYVRTTPNCLWFGLGDMCECIAPNDKRWHAGGIDERVVNLASQDRIGDVYVEKMAAKLAPIADRLVSYGTGNHEAAFLKHYYSDLSLRILDRIGRSDAYTEWASLTRLAFEDKHHHRFCVRVYASHGWQGGRMDGAKVNEVRRLMAYVDADIYLQGHSHSKFVIPQTRLDCNQSWTKLVARKVYVAHTGSFLRTLQQDSVGYAEQKGYPPTTIGTVKFLLTPNLNAGTVDIEALT
jgi:hypothetical protein